MSSMCKAITATLSFSLLVLAGCRSPGLPPEPPEADAANPEAGLVEAKRQANPFTRSAFEGVELGGGGGHEHHHHGHGAKETETPAKPEAPAKTEAPAKPEAPAKGSPESHEHAGHGGRS